MRLLIVDAARELFVENGFANTSTKDIATRASVTESVLFRHFKTKADIFDNAVLAPFTSLMEEFVDRWTALPHEDVSPIDHGRAYVTALYELCSDNRDLMRVLTSVGREASTDGEGASALAPIQNHLAQMQATLEDYLRVEGATMIDLGLALRFTMALVLGGAVFDEELFGDGAYDRAQLPDAMLQFILFGIGFTPAAGT
ncbi:MAG: transcriptional regulator, partial [Aeromicrobium sp.]|nr:transcriptional regulator [Aeromicrobium sp.]